MPEERRTRNELNTYIHQVVWLVWVIAQLVLAALPRAVSPTLAAVMLEVLLTAQLVLAALSRAIPNTSSSSNGVIVGSAAGVGRPLEGHTQH